MNFDLSELRAFVAVAELRSFHAAAEALHLSQSALSRRIGKLERALGAWFYEVRHVSMLPPLVEAGLGVAALPRLAMPLGEHPSLASVPLDEPTVTRTLGLIRKRGRALSPPAQQLYALIDEAQRGSEPQDSAEAGATTARHV